MTGREHPAWCVAAACTVGEPGGEHASKLRLIPADNPAGLLVDLVQRDGEPAKLRLTCGDAEVRMPLRSAWIFSGALRDLAQQGRRAEQ